MRRWLLVIMTVWGCLLARPASASICGVFQERVILGCSEGSCSVRMHLASVLLPDRCDTRPVFSATHPSTSAAAVAFVREHHGLHATGVFDVYFFTHERGGDAIGAGPFDPGVWRAQGVERVEDVDAALEAARAAVQNGERQRVIRFTVLSAEAVLVLLPILLAPWFARRRVRAGRAPVMTPALWLGVAFGALLFNFFFLTFCPPYWTRPLMLVVPLAIWAAAGTKLAQRLS